MSPGQTVLMNEGAIHRKVLSANLKGKRGEEGRNQGRGDGRIVRGGEERERGREREREEEG